MILNLTDTKRERTKVTSPFYFRINYKDSKAILWANFRSQFFNIRLKISCSQNPKSIAVEISKARTDFVFNAENYCQNLYVQLKRTSITLSKGSDIFN